MINNFLIVTRIPIQILTIVILVKFLNIIMENRGEKEKWLNPILFISIGIHRYIYNFIIFSENKYEFFLITLQILIYLIFCKKGRIIEKIFWSLFTSGTLVLGFVVSYITTAYVYELPLKEIVLRKGEFFTSYGLGLIIPGIIFYSVSKKKIELKNLAELTIAFFIGIIILDIAKIWKLIYMIFQGGGSPTGEDLWWCYEALLIFIGIMKVMENFSNQNKIFLERELKERNAYEVEKHAREIYAIVKKLKGWNHDWKNHLIAINYFLEKNELEKLKEYIRKIKGDAGEIFESLEIVKTGNVIIDALFNSKSLLANSKNIKMDIEVGVSKNYGISDLDFCTILGNILDNALEANGNGGWIKFKLYNMKGNIIILMDNSINEKIIQNGDKFITRKKDGFHGIGLIQIDETVKKYRGKLIRKVEKGVFHTKIVIPTGETIKN